MLYKQLIIGEDETLYALQCKWYRGQEVFPLLATTPTKSCSEEHQEMATQDLVYAMLKMDLLARLRYSDGILVSALMITMKVPFRSGTNSCYSRSDIRHPHTSGQAFFRRGKGNLGCTVYLSTFASNISPTCQCPRLMDTLRREFIDFAPPVPSWKPSHG